MQSFVFSWLHSSSQILHQSGLAGQSFQKKCPWGTVSSHTKTLMSTQAASHCAVSPWIESGTEPRVCSESEAELGGHG